MASAVVSSFKYGVRGVFYFLKNIFRTLFFVLLGLVTGLVVNVQQVFGPDYATYIFIGMGVSLPLSFSLWLYFRRLHNKSVEEHIDQLQVNLMQDLKKDGLLSQESFDAARLKIGQRRKA